MNKQARIFVAGHRGLVGSAIVRRLRALGYEQLVFAERRELDLTRQAEVEAWFAAHRPEVVIMAAAKVGGIHANNSYAGRFHSRQPGDADQRHRRGLSSTARAS